MAKETDATGATTVDRARRYLCRFPPAISGQRGHDQTFAVACALVHGFALSEYEALVLLQEYNRRCHPPWTEGELLHKIQSALVSTHNKPRGYLIDSQALSFAARSRPRLSEAPPVKIDPTTAAEVFLRGFRCDEVDLWEASPIRPPDDWTQDATVLLESLYQRGDLVNFVAGFTIEEGGKAKPKDRGETMVRDALIARWLKTGTPCSEAGAWLRMNPLDGRGITDVNVTNLRFALIECDVVPLELQLPLLARLPLPISAILTSGGRSIHAWVRVDAESLEDYRQTVARMLGLLAKFGVDGKNRNPSRLSRLPGVMRRIGGSADGRQRLLYLNPQPKQRAIL